MTLPTTTLYALPLIAIWLTLWMRVSGARSSLNCSFGDGGNMALLQKVRQHGNAALIPSAAFGTVEVRPLMNYNPAEL